MDARRDPLIVLRARVNLLAAKGFGRPVPTSLLLEDARALGLDETATLDALARLVDQRYVRPVEGGWLPMSAPVRYRGLDAWAERSQIR